ncbi:hypothetical protein IM725_18125 [Ramlibacter aquaticus]|uniref:Uncharacterized protein n=1 Tax=Ramlibacter aquaticus TaxID=2780094 RepID=A0ABR9SJD7_9BURK|nr:hypothetical protein [Ramlibacter aquaticus]MBE7942488.1 hypothetical protein [Ramlibacter aquaticus]
MTIEEQIKQVQTRLQRATTHTALLQQGGGGGEQYLTSYFLVEALELQLARLRMHRRATSEPVLKSRSLA